MGCINPEFSEAQYQCLVDRFLRDDFINGPRFEINFYSGIDERNKGYDIEVLTYIPIYLQIKRSYFYPKNMNCTYLPQRENFGFDDNPGAFSFNLHVDAQTGDYRQHNLLYQLITNNSYARYVAPLFYQKRVLEFLNYNKQELIWATIYNALVDSNTSHYWRDYVLLPHSITIVPHKHVNKTPGFVHKYFFNHNKQISFHSDPERVRNEENLLLIEFINKIRSQYLRGESSDFNSVFNTIKHVIEKDLFENDNRQINFYNDRMLLENLYLQCFDKGKRFTKTTWNKLFEKENELDVFYFMTNFLLVKHNILTLLVSWH